MRSPLDKHTGQTDKPDCLDVSPERLEAMSPSELADAMEQALDAMTEETYDPAVIHAYLDALDRKTPMPEPPDAEEAYADFQRKLQTALPGESVEALPQKTKRTGNVRRIFRASLAAALLIACLLGSMVAAQAVGLDVFGALAHWTDSLFSFGTEQRIDKPYYPSEPATSARQADGSDQSTEAVPEEFSALQTTMEQRGLSLYVPIIPEEFEVQDSLLFIDPNTESVTFTIIYKQGSDHIIFNIEQRDGPSATIYEKDNEHVETYEYGDIIYYIYNNNDSIAVVWSIDSLEYSLFTNLPADELKEIIQSMY